MSTVIEIECIGNKNHMFEPADKVVRGEFDFLSIKEPQARMMADRWPERIPGQRIRLDVDTGVGSIIDPLHDAQHAAVAERIKKRFRLPPAKEEFPNAHVATWIHRMQRAVNAGHAKLTQGEFPEKLPGKPIERYLTMDEETPAEKQANMMLTVMQKLVVTLDKMNETMSSLAERGKK